MLPFIQFLLEYPIEYFQKMPITSPPERVAAAQKRFGLEGVVKWHVLTNKSIHQSEELDDDVIVMKPGDTLENWFHELGHEVYDHSSKKTIKPLLDRIKESCKPSTEWMKKEGGRFKWISLGGYKYSYTHSGKAYEYDELFAITFAFIVGDNGKFKDTSIQQDYEEMLDGLTA
jgi:hypothetical protein